MKRSAEQIHGYNYGAVDVAMSPVSIQELENLKITVGWTDEDPRYLRLADCSASHDREEE